MLPNRVRGGRGRRLLVLALAAALCSAAWAEPIKVPELLAPGSVAVGAEGIPLIKAQNEHDLAFLQGYAHARDRFFQMDYSRRGASGTIAELLGQPALANDVQTRTLGLRRAAWATWQAASADTRAWLKAYADGVNYWLRSTPSLPPEYQALEISQVEPWSPVDSVVIGKALAFQLSFDLDIQATLEVGGYQQAGQAGGFDGAALYFGDTHRFAPPDNRVTIPPASGAALSASAGEKIALVGATGAGKSTVASLLLRLYDVEEGAVRVFGRDVSAYPRDELRRKGVGVGSRRCEVDADGDRRHGQRRRADAAPQRQRVPPAGPLPVREQPPLELRPHGGRRQRLGKLGVECRQPAAPEAEVGPQRRIGPQPRGDRRMLGRGEQPQRIFGGEEPVLASTRNVRVVAHADRHSLSFIRLRRSQVRIVLSGTS